MQLGKLSSWYESGARGPGAISSGEGDAGGKSYGLYQFASGMGVSQAFTVWLRETGREPFASILYPLRSGTREFDIAWTKLAEDFPAEFADAQHNYTQHIYYDPSIDALRNAGYNIENHHEVMKDVVWSRAVQYGTGYIVEMFETAAKRLGYPNLSYVDAPNFDADMIRAIYLNVCKSPEWTNASPSLRQGLYNRFDSECAAALAMLNQEA